MRLSRNLFYALMLLFIAGIILICLVDAASVWSRIAAGLVTGSFVGAVNTLVNYFHQRKEFFSKYSISAFEMSLEIRKDFSMFNARMEYLRSALREDIIKNDQEKLNARLVKFDKVRDKYETFGRRLNVDDYVALFGMSKKLSKSLSDMEVVVRHINFMGGNLIVAYSFGILAAQVSKEEQMLVIGDPDESYDYIMQKNVDFRDMLVFNISELASVCKKMHERLKGMLDKQDLEEWLIAAETLSASIEGYEVRDVLTESVNRIEEELKDSNEGSD